MSRVKKEYRTYGRDNYDRFMAKKNISPAELPYSKYKKNLDICNWMFVEYALATGAKVPLPYGFGSLAVNKKKLKRFKEFNGKSYINLRPDWQKTRKLGKKIYHTNEHTDGFNFKWIWFRDDAKIHLSDIYVFKPARYASRAITKYVTKPDSQYKEIYLEWTRK